MRKRKNREINVFSTSAIDLFASALGVFILLMVVTIPYYTRTDYDPSRAEVDKLTYERLKQELETASQAVEELQRENAALKRRIVELELKMKSLEPPLEDDVRIPKAELDQLRERLAALERENEQLKKSLEELQALQSDPELAEKLQAQIAALKSEIDQLKAEIEALRAEVAQQRKTIEQLEAELKELREVDQSSFVVIIAQWTTERHDLDLEVITPDGLRYNYRNKRHEGASGFFSLDSRTGPGTEVFQSADAIPGEYTVIYDFYNPYGNTDPLEASGTILTSAGSFPIQSVTMDFQTNRQEKFRFRLDSSGQVHMLGNGVAN